MSAFFKVVMAVVTAFSGIGSYVSFAFVEELFTDAVSLVIPRSDFLEETDSENVAPIDESSGYVQDTILLFFAEEAGFFKKLDALHETGGITIGSMPDMNLCVIKTRRMSFDEINAYCENLMEHEAVALATICPVHRIEEQYTPNDPFTDYDWYTEEWNEKFPDGNNWWIEAIDARSAWGYNSLYEHIDIGVVDGGFDLKHEDLKGKITFPSKSEESRNRSNYHGTHVAGIISANADNGVGISGVCQNAELICVDWTPSDGQLWIPDAAVLFGFGKVVKAGAKVVNLSIGISGSVISGKKSFPAIVNLFDAMIYSYSMDSLLNKGYDFVVVQSAGNGNDDGHAISASQNGVFCGIKDYGSIVSAFGVDTQKLLDRIIIVGSADVVTGGYVQSSSSNVGDAVDICAPGVDVYSCAPDNIYYKMSGTSMAAPVVTGVASLVWAANPSLTAPEVKRIVCENTEDFAEPATEKHFSDVGHQRYPMVNAKLAVEAALMQKGGFARVGFSGYSNEPVVFTGDSGKRFVFETDEQGELNCVLPLGTYTMVLQDTNANIEINEDITITTERTNNK